MSNTALPQELIQAVEQADSSERLVAAVRALADARLAAGIPQLITALGYNNPVAAVAAVEGLIQLGEEAVQPLLSQLDDYNYGARAYAIRVLAAIADPRALEVLLTAALNDFAPSVRRAAAKGLGSLHWHQLRSDPIQSVSQALKTLLQVCEDPDWSIRYAAVVGLQSLASQRLVLPQIQSQFEEMAQTETDPAVRARVHLAHKLAVSD